MTNDSRRAKAAFSFYDASGTSVEQGEAEAVAGDDALSVGPGVDIALVKQAVGDRICIVGNLDPIGVLLKGTPEQVRAETRRVMMAGKQNGGYIFNSGEMVPHMTPEENVWAMVETAREFGQT